MQINRRDFLKSTAASPLATKVEIISTVEQADTGIISYKQASGILVDGRSFEALRWPFELYEKAGIGKSSASIEVITGERAALAALENGFALAAIVKPETICGAIDTGASLVAIWSIAHLSAPACLALLVAHQASLDHPESGPLLSEVVFALRWGQNFAARHPRRAADLLSIDPTILPKAPPPIRHILPAHAYRLIPISVWGRLRLTIL